MTARLVRVGLPPHRLRQRAEREQRARPPSRGRLSRGDGARPASPPCRSRSSTTRGRSCRRPARGRCATSLREEPEVDAVFFTSDVYRRRRDPRLPRAGHRRARTRWASPASTTSRSGGSCRRALTTVHVPAMEIGRQGRRDDPGATRRARRGARAARARLRDHRARKHTAQPLKRITSRLRRRLTASQVTGNMILSSEETSRCARGQVRAPSRGGSMSRTMLAAAAAAAVRSRPGLHWPQDKRRRSG